MNNNQVNKKKSFFSNKRFKYGSAAVAFTAVVIAVIIAANAIFGALCTALLWYADMTTEQLYGITDASRELLADLSKEDVHIKIIFLAPKDKLEEVYFQKLVHQCALTYAKEFDFVEVDYLDIITNPTSVNKYKTTAATNLKTTNVIIENGKDFRVFTIEAFFTFAESDNSVFAFNGEFKITTAIMQLCYNHPIAYFTVGHGETTTSSQLAGLFEAAGYDVRTIDLSKENIDPAAQVVVINGPHYDFLGAKQEVNEIGKISDFLDSFGNLMVFMDANSMGTQDFFELNQFLSEWGIAFGKSVIKDPNNSISADGFSLVSQYKTDGLGSSLTTSLRALETIPKAIVRYTMPIDILWDTRTIDQGSRTVSPVLVSSDTAESYSFDNQDVAASAGAFNLVTISQDSVYVDNQPFTSYVLAVGTTSFTNQDYLASNAYGNADIIYSAMKAMGREKVPLNIDFRLFENKKLTITSAQANVWTIVYTALIPVIVLGCGMVVWIKRRHL